MKVEIEESKLQTAYANACDGVKDFMESLFGKKVFEAAKPTLDDYKTIRTYEDACVALKQDAIRVDSVNRDTTTVLTNGGDRVNMPSHIVALMKLETISRALWGRDFQPKPDGEGSKVYWYPWFALYTKKEINDMYNIETELDVHMIKLEDVNGCDAEGYDGTTLEDITAIEFMIQE